MKKKTAPPAPKFPHAMVYLGIRLVGLGLDRKRAFVWGRLKHVNGTLEDETKSALFSKNLQKRASPGSVFIMQGDESGANLFINSGDYKGKYREEEATVRWWTLHRAAEAEAETLSKTGAALRRQLDLERLTPIKLAYSRASNLHRGLIIANVVKFITGGLI